jgi:hypothetical protein
MIGRDSISGPGSSRTGQRAFDKAALLPSILRVGEAALSGGRENQFIQAKRPPAIAGSPSCSGGKAIMAEINKLSIEKAFDKLRARDAKQSKDVIFNDSVAALIEEIKRIRTQARRLEHHERKRDKDDR